MATRKCGNIYFRKHFMAVRKFTNIFVLLLILMVGSRDVTYPVVPPIGPNYFTTLLSNSYTSPSVRTY